MPTAYEYYAAVLYALGEISQGRTPTKACDAANISYEMFDKYTTNDPALQALREAAERRGYDTMADLLLSLREPTNPYFTTDPKEQKVISDNIKWLLARRRSKDYGDRVEVKVEQTVTHVITQQLEAGRQRALAAPRPADVVDAEYHVIPPPPPPPY